MATTKKTAAGKPAAGRSTAGKSKSTAAKSTAAASKSTAGRTDPQQLEALIARIGAEPTEAQRRAWLTQYPPSLTQTWAGKTSAAKTELEAFNWASQAADLVLNSQLAKELHYPPARLVFLLECVQDVAAQRAQAHEGAPEIAGGRLERGAAESAAERAFSRLNSALRSAAASHAERAGEIRSALASATPRTDTSARIDALAAVADRWTSGADKDLALLCAERDVAGLAQAARLASERLRKGRSAVAGKASSGKDSAELNLCEARMLGEMAALRSSVRRARRQTDDKRYVQLKPVATATIFVKGDAAGDDDDDDDGDVPGGGAAAGASKGGAVEKTEKK